MTVDNAILSKIASYYESKIAEFGAIPKGVDWNTLESQEMRFDVLLNVCDSGSFSLNDYGCGYGALCDHIQRKGMDCEYRGFDLSPVMIREAQALHKQDGACLFFSDPAHLSEADYTVASGIFNVRFDISDENWERYMQETIDKMANLSAKGFAFNVLSSYSDPEYRRPDLYYADPLFWFDYCMQKYPRAVSLIHDYPLYEFTITVKKQR